MRRERDDEEEEVLVLEDDDGDGDDDEEDDEDDDNDDDDEDDGDGDDDGDVDNDGDVDINDDGDVDNDDDDASTGRVKRVQSAGLYMKPNKFDDKADLYAKVVIKERPLHDVTVSRKKGGSSNKKDVHIVCQHGTSCLFYVNGRMNGESWFVTSFNAGHTCDALESPLKAASARKRGHTHNTVKAILGEGVEARSNPSEVKAIAKKKGIELGSQAASRLISQTEDASDYDYLLDFHLVPTLVETMKREDPDGLYLLETQKTDYADNTFFRVFGAFGGARLLFLNDHVGLVAIDGTFLKHEFSGTLLLATSQDAAKMLVVLAWGICSSENGSNCGAFAEFVRTAYPTMKIVMQDEGTALNGQEARAAYAAVSESVRLEAEKLGVVPTANVHMANCSSHMRDPVQKQCPGTSGVGEAIQKVALARTQKALDEAMEEARQKDQRLFDSLLPRREALSLAKRLEKGLASNGITTNQLVEIAANMVAVARKLGAARMILWLNEHEGRKYAERKQAAKNRVHVLTPKMEEIAVECQRRSATLYNVITSEISDTRASGLVGKTDGTTVHCSMTRNPETGLIEFSCPCLHFEEFGIPCGRAQCLMRFANQHCKDLNLGVGLWSWKSSRSYHPRVLTVTWRKQYEHPFVVFSRPPLLNDKQSAKNKIHGLLKQRALDAPDVPSSLDLYPPPFAPSGGRKKGKTKNREKKEQRRKKAYTESAPYQKKKAKK